MILHENHEYSREVSFLTGLKCPCGIFKPFLACFAILYGILVIELGCLKHDHRFSYVLRYPGVVRKFKLSFIGQEKALIFAHPACITQQ
mgnify:CR=1 FL=1